MSPKWLIFGYLKTHNYAKSYFRQQQTQVPPCVVQHDLVTPLIVLVRK